MKKQSFSLKIGVSGVKGVAGQSLTPRLVTSFAAAFGACCGPGLIVVGTDTRPSREMVTQAAISGLLSVGCAPLSVGILPVPILQFYVRSTAAAGGICITASHNPLEWNALKFFGKDGIALRPNQFAELTDMYHQGLYPRVDADHIQEARSDDAAVPLHRRAILDAVDVEMVRSRKFKVVVDCCNGASYRAAPELLRALGCEVTELFTDLTSPFPRNSEPIRENIADLCVRVRQVEADLGFALDADGDRLALVDEAGLPLGEDCTLAIAVRYLLGLRPGPVVVNLSTTRMIEDLAAEHRCPVHRTPVGEINVIERMIECRSDLGGEGNGGVIIPSLNPCRDSFVGMAFVLEALSHENSTLSELRERLPSYFIVKRKVFCRPRDVASTLRVLRYFYQGQTVDLTDGLKVLWPDRWIHVRGSNTEAALRVIAEAPSEEEAAWLAAEALDHIRPLLP